jgi:murein DD-endopeptidase MepM/ murein hydrolase activator NlpD
MHNRRMRVLLFALVLAAFAPRPAAAQDFQLPIDCRVGEVCLVQNYADSNPAADAAADPQCGPLTYDGHDGLDFRAPAALARSGVNVLAPAAGIVRGVRDGEPEGVYLREGRAAVQNRECGNGVRIDHGGGWSSQLCHMRAGSMRVREGERVRAGQALGLVGLSGFTQFPHVHMRLERNGALVDPLTGSPMAALSCGARGAAAGAHWGAGARTALAYQGTRILAFGFTGAAPSGAASVEDLPANAARNAPVLVLWALASGPHNRDMLRVQLYGPDGALIAEGSRTQPRDQAQASVFAGRPTPAGGWPAGAYRGVAEVLRAGRVVQSRTQTITLR